MFTFFIFNLLCIKLNIFIYNYIEEKIKIPLTKNKIQQIMEQVEDKRENLISFWNNILFSSKLKIQKKSENEYDIVNLHSTVSESNKKEEYHGGFSKVTFDDDWATKKLKIEIFAGNEVSILKRF